jgi:hypothetical protein
MEASTSLIDGLEVGRERDRAHLVEERAERLVQRMAEVREEPVAIVDLDNDEVAEVERRRLVVCGAESHATADLVAANARMPSSADASVVLSRAISASPRSPRGVNSTTCVIIA